MPELTPEQKAQLDKNIRSMLSQGASQDDVTNYANDFKLKYDTELKKKGSVSSGVENTTASNGLSGGRLGGSAKPVDEKKELADYITSLKTPEQREYSKQPSPIVSTTNFKKNETPFDQTKEEAFAGASKKLGDIMYGDGDGWKDPIKTSLNGIKSSQSIQDALNYYGAKNLTEESLMPDGFEANRILSSTHFGNSGDDNLTAKALRNKVVDYEKSVAPFRGINPNELTYLTKDRLYDAAIRSYANKNEHFKKQLEAAGIDINANDIRLRMGDSDAKVGQVMSAVLDNPDLRTFIQKENPDLLPAIQDIQENLIYDNKDYGKVQLANEISRDMQKSGYNKIDPIFNFEGNAKDAGNATAEVLYANDPKKLQFYRDNKDEILNKLDAPSLMTGFAEAGRGFGKGLINTFTQPFESLPKTIKEGWEKEASHVSADPKGLVKFLSDSGHALGFVASIGATGNVLGGIGFSPNAASMTSLGVGFLGDNLEQAKMKYPDSPVKQWTSALFNTGLFMAMGKSIFPAAKVEQAFARVQPGVSKVIENLTAGKITREAARVELNNFGKQALEIAGSGLQKNIKVSAEMTGITILNKAMDRILGMDKQAFAEFHPEGEESDTFKSMFLSNIIVNGLAARGQVRAKNNMAKESIYEAASNPNRYRNIIESSEISKNVQNTKEILDNLDYVTNLKKELDTRDLSEKQKKDYLFNALQSKVLNASKPASPDATLTRRHQERIKNIEEINEGILSGKDADEVVTTTEQKAIDELQKVKDEGDKATLEIEKLTKNQELDDKEIDAKIKGLDKESTTYSVQKEKLEQQRKEKKEEYESKVEKLTKPSLIAQAIEAVDKDLPEYIRAGAKANIEAALKEAAEQLNSTTGEAETARKFYGKTFSDIALKLFPDAKTEIDPEGKLAKMNEEIDQKRELADENTPDEVVSESEAGSGGVVGKSDVVVDEGVVDNGLSEGANKILGLHDNGVNFDLFDNNKLREIAKENGIDLPEGAKNADIIEALKNKRNELANKKNETQDVNESIGTEDNTETILATAEKKGGIYAQLAKAVKNLLGGVKTTVYKNLSDFAKHIEEEVSTHGAYDESNKTIHINNATDKNKLHIFFHEALHHITIAKIKEFEKNPNSKNLTPSEFEAILNLKRIYKQISEKVNRDRGGFGKQSIENSPTNLWMLGDRGTDRGFANVHEFISEAFTNPEFQKILSQFKGEGKEPNLFKQFVNAVAKMLGLKDPTILDDIFHHTEKLIDKEQSLSKPESGGKAPVTKSEGGKAESIVEGERENVREHWALSNEYRINELAEQATSEKHFKELIDKEIELESKKTPKLAQDDAESKYAVGKLTEQNQPSEELVKNIERKAESQSEADLNEVVQKADELIDTAVGVKRKKLSEINTDESRFQGRGKLNEGIVNEISKNFSDADQDPIHIWADPKDGKTYVLSGHHRYYGAKKAGRADVKVIDRTKDFTEQQAIKFAKEEANANRSMETPLERANTLREKRQRGDDKKDIAAFLDKEGKNKTFVDNLSYLNPKGKAVELLTQFERAEDKQTQKESERIADWIGEARKRNENLTNQHENEMFDYLKSEQRVTNKVEFVEKVSKASFGIRENEPLNLKKVIDKSENRIDWEDKRDELKSQVNELKSQTEKDKQTGWTGLQKDYITRLANDRFKGDADAAEKEFKKTENQEIYNKKLEDKKAELKSIQDKLAKHLLKENDLIKGDKAQQNLFEEPEPEYGKIISIDKNNPTTVEIKGEERKLPTKPAKDKQLTYTVSGFGGNGAVVTIHETPTVKGYNSGKIQHSEIFNTFNEAFEYADRLKKANVKQLYEYQSEKENKTLPATGRDITDGGRTTSLVSENNPQYGNDSPYQKALRKVREKTPQSLNETKQEPTKDIKPEQADKVKELEAERDMAILREKVPEMGNVNEVVPTREAVSAGSSADNLTVNKRKRAELKNRYTELQKLLGCLMK